LPRAEVSPSAIPPLVSPDGVGQVHLELVASSAEDPDVYGGASIAQLERWKEGKGYWQESPGAEVQGAMQICDWREAPIRPTLT